MKLVKFLLVSGVIIGGGLFGAMYWTQHDSGELAGVMDYLNPLVKEGTVYIKTKKADQVNEHGIASYTQTAANQTGQTREITFTADHELHTGRYLKVYNKGAHVKTYEEVEKKMVPTEALKMID